jgi:hypothetical protein
VARYCSFIGRPKGACPSFKQTPPLLQTEGLIGKQRNRLEAATRERQGFGTNPSCNDCDTDKYIVIKCGRNLHLGPEG